MKRVACLVMLLMALTTLSCAKERFYFIEAEEGTYVMDRKTGEFHPYLVNSQES